ncbi:hypothetical protein [Neobacillus soli]|uniref:hypothetical protein n=1 Tax=Neobacillus soli TaxID=220688 RepID=UPI000826D6DE|nr:hypothetical protein [Neobacillus soli]
MDSEYFIEAIVSCVRDTAVDDTLSEMEEPSGRKPRKKDLELSEWYNKQSVSDKEMIKKALYEAVDASLFGIFAVIDGVRPIEGAGNKGVFKLYFDKDGEKKLLNEDSKQYLHDIYNSITNSID